MPYDEIEVRPNTDPEFEYHRGCEDAKGCSLNQARDNMKTASHMLTDPYFRGMYHESRRIIGD